MKEILASVTAKGQVTIPVEIRRLLGVSPHDKVAFVVEDDQVRLARTGTVVRKTAGALRSAEPLRNALQLREEGERAIAEEAVQRSGV